ncbi:MAG: DUF5615 family PIN-like protein [Betaproteobacteria bacterium]|nr:DUF5615 family PIN-like protein [Betaproteobacteria bacterium]
MRLLLDSCVWKGALVALVAAGHDVVWTGAWAADPGDEEILAFALKEARIVVTLDKDFGELAVAFGREHAGIVRLVGFPVRRQAEACLAAIAAHGDVLPRGAIVTVEPGRLRFRPPTDDCG